MNDPQNRIIRRCFRDFAFVSCFCPLIRWHHQEADKRDHGVRQPHVEIQNKYAVRRTDVQVDKERQGSTGNSLIATLLQVPVDAFLVPLALQLQNARYNLDDEVSTNLCSVCRIPLSLSVRKRKEVNVAVSPEEFRIGQISVGVELEGTAKREPELVKL